MTCSGNSSQTCGNGDRLSVYSTGNAGPTTSPGIGSWAYLACYTDSTNSRTLRSSQSVDGGSSNMTVAGCTSACQAAGYSLAGVEFGSECWCDNNIHNSASVAQSGCSMPCSGDPNLYCGGQVRLNVCQLNKSSSSGAGAVPPGWQALGCYTDDVSNRTLSSSQDVQGGYSNMTVGGCLDACSSAGFLYGGLEFSQECW